MKIDNTSALIDVLRSRLTSRGSGVRNLSEQAREIGSAEQGAAPVSVEVLRRRFGREVRTLNLKLPSDQRRARVALIETLLTWEFGEELLNDPELGFLVRDVEESIESSPRVLSALNEFILGMHTSSS